MTLMEVVGVSTIVTSSGGTVIFRGGGGCTRSLLRVVIFPVGVLDSVNFSDGLVVEKVTVRVCRRTLNVDQATVIVFGTSKKGSDLPVYSRVLGREVGRKTVEAISKPRPGTGIGQAI